MSEKWKQKTLLIFPFAVLAAGMILTAAFFLHTYRQIAFELRHYAKPYWKILLKPSRSY